MFNDIISTLYFKVVKDIIAAFIADERDNQILIAKNKGLSEEYIKNNIYFTIFTDKFKPLLQENLPCVVIDIDSVNYPTNMQYADKIYTNANLNIYLFANGYSANDNINIIDGNLNPTDRLDYLLSQLLQICNSEKAFNFGTENNRNIDKSLFIDKKQLLSWKRFLVPQNQNQLNTILSYVAEYNISFNEYFQQITGKELKEIYSNLKIKNEFIDPLIQILF